jgi:hypothetical protein
MKATAVTVAALLLATAIGAEASDISKKIARYDYRADRRQMAGLAAARRNAAEAAGPMVVAFRESAPSAPATLSSGPTLTSTRIEERSIGGDQVSRKAEEWAAFQARPARANDPGLYMDSPDSLRALTEPLGKLAAAAAAVAPYGALAYYYYDRENDHHHRHR